MEFSLENKMLDAIKAKNIKLVSKLLSKGANPNKTVRNGMTCLGQAVSTGLTDIAKLLIAKSHSDNRVSSDNDNDENESDSLKTRKKEASIRPLKKKLDMLSIYTKYTTDRAEKEGLSKNCNELGYGSGSSSEDSKVQSPQSDLEWDENIGKVAANTKEDDLTIDLYQWYATILETTGAALVAASDFTYGIDQEDALGKTALSYACEEDNLEIFKALVQAGCKVDAIDTVTGRTVLHSACDDNRLEFIEVLLAAGCDVNRRSPLKTATTALHIAACKSLEMTTKLVDHGAMLEIRDEWDQTPLFIAAEHGFSDIVEFLLSRGARLNIQDAGGHTPLCMAVKHNHVDSADLLLENGSRITHFQCMIHHAVRHRHYKMTSLLANRGCGLNVPNCSGDTPLMIAMETEQPILFANLLLDKGANVNFCNHMSGASVLHSAVDSIEDPEEFESFLNTLLNYHIDINLHIANRDTALNRAILLQRDPSAMVLVRYGADPNIFELRIDAPGNLLIASSRKNNKLSQMLIEAGHNIITATDVDDYVIPEWITEVFRSPLSLANICRIRIRNMRNRKYKILRDFVWLLPIPEPTKNFLMMKNYV